MKMDFCTLFDSNYIDRVLVMYDSLEGVCSDVTLYVIAFDRMCYESLTELAPPHMVVIPYDEFEDDVLRTVKADRSRREYLWTCSGYSIRYIMKRFDLSHITYVDSDLYFYVSPDHVIQKFLDSGCDAAIVSHRFSDHPENTYTARVCGQYCVEFNSFRNTENGMKILDWWIDRCIECCPQVPTDGLFGDQKYLDRFPDMFDGVYVYEDFGLGIAPWNVDDYVKSGKNGIRNRYTGESGSLVFYHFHSLDVYEDGGSNIRVFVRPGKHDAELVESLYKPYMKRLMEKRLFLRERFGLFGLDDNGTEGRLKDGEIKAFLTCEPNLWFLIRKIWRYLLYKKKDYMRYE